MIIWQSGEKLRAKLQAIDSSSVCSFDHWIYRTVFDHWTHTTKVTRGALTFISGTCTTGISLHSVTIKLTKTKISYYIMSF